MLVPKAPLGLIVSIICATTTVPAADPLAEDTASAQLPEQKQDEHGLWRFEFDNDFLLGTDNGLTVGWSVQRHTEAAATWDQVTMPDWLAAIGDAVPGINHAGRNKRFGFGFGQLLQTPNELRIAEPQPGDVPYAAALGAFAAWTAVNDDHLVGMQVYLGTSGPPALGEEVQSNFHELIDDTDPKGWDHQIGAEPLLNLSYGHWWKISGSGGRPGLHGDVAAGLIGSLGNLRTTVDGVIRSRIGWNLPEGFTAIPDPGGRGIAQIPRPGPVETDAYYLTLSARSTYVAHTLFLDGSLFDEDEPEAPGRKDVIYQGLVGFHYERPGFAVRLQYVLSSEFAEVGDKETNRDWGAITLEWAI